MNAIDSFRYLWLTDKSMSEVVVKHFLSHDFRSGASSCITSYTTRHLAERIRNLSGKRLRRNQEETT